MPRSRAASLPALLLLAALGTAPASKAQDVLAIVSPPPGPYEAAHKAFASAVGRDVPVVRLPGRVPAGGARVVIAFGSEAAVQRYPERSTLIVCVAPGLASRIGRPGRTVFVAMKPSPGRLLAEVRRVQPGLRRFAVLSTGPDTEEYVSELRRAGSGLGIEILAPPATGRDGVPRALRSLAGGKADAVWLAPDPALVTPGNFQAIVQFSSDNDVPFYAPTRGLAATGAAGAVSVSPEEAGRMAADFARRTLSGEKLPAVVYPARTGLTVSVKAAKAAGLALDPGALDKDIEVLP